MNKYMHKLNAFRGLCKLTMERQSSKSPDLHLISLAVYLVPVCCSIPINVNGSSVYCIMAIALCRRN